MRRTLRRSREGETRERHGVSRRQILSAVLGGCLARPLLSSGAMLLGGGQIAQAAEEPLRFAHVYGETVLPAPAQRVVSLGYTSQDALLALGVAPVAVRQWFGNYPYGIWPWAQPFLGEVKPQMISGEVSMEIVAALQPDLIVAVGSGISKDEYDVLSQIAPVLMQPPGEPTYGMRWDAMTRMIGLAVGRLVLAEQKIAAVEALFAQARLRHPDWAGRTALCAYHYGGETGAYTASDTRATFLAELGFRPTEKITRLSVADGFYARLSPEDLSPLDADALIWLSNAQDGQDIAAVPLRKTLRAHREGREILASELLTGALTFGSVLSLPFALQALEAEISLAIDGDPATPVPSSVAAGARPVTRILCLLLLLAIAACLTLLVGVQHVRLPDVWKAVAAFDPADPAQIVARAVRLPRLFAGLIAGAGLGMAGTVMQAVTRNPLADPGLLGVNAGAAFAVVLAALLTGHSDSGMISALTFPGAAIASIAVFLLGGARGGAAGPVRLTLAGVALNALLLSLISAIILARSEVMDVFRFWATGSLAQAGTRPLSAMAIALVLGAALALASAPKIEALALGSALARGLGTRPGQVQLAALGAVTLMTGASVAVAGPIAFLGLIVPPLSRRLARHRLRMELVISTLLGASIILLADTLGRVILAPAEIRVGIMTALVGAPVFVLLVRRLRPGALA